MLSLLVLKTQKMDECRKFYEALGLKFVEEKHGDGPVHYSCKIGELVFELYPSKKEPNERIRLGFKVANPTQVCHDLDLSYACEKLDGWIVTDPDGRRVCLQGSCHDQKRNAALD